jgi:ParB family chromosome partitioning protein
MSQPAKRLGRGLSGLISGGAKPAPEPAKPAPVTPSAPATSAKPVAATSVADGFGGSFTVVPVAKIEPNPWQPRREFDPVQLSQLADSIRSEGLLQPPVVRPTKTGGYQLIAGERRFRACQLLQLKSIPVRVIEANDASSATLALIENLQREGLNPIDEALGYATLLNDFHLTQEELAKRLGKGRPTIANALRLLGLDKEIQGFLARGLLSAGHAKALLGLDDPAQRLVLARRIVEEGLSVRTAEQLVQQGRDRRPATSPSSPPVSAHKANAVARTIAALEKNLVSHLGTRVQLQHGAKKGKLVIEYYGDEDLQRIVELMGLK